MRSAFYPIWYINKNHKRQGRILKINISVICSTLVLISVLTYFQFNKLKYNSNNVEEAGLRYNVTEVERNTEEDRIYNKIEKLSSVLDTCQLSVDFLEIKNDGIYIQIVVPQNQDCSILIKNITRFYIIKEISSSNTGKDTKKISMRIKENE